MRIYVYIYAGRHVTNFDNYKPELKVTFVG